MATDKQRNAARVNGAKSRGPVTDQGKAISCRNNTRHGMLADTIVLDDESRPRFEALRRSLLRAMKPGSPLEELLVQKMVVAQWRQSRAWGMEKAGYHMPVPEQQDGAASEFPMIRDTAAFRGQGPYTALLQRYELNCDRQFVRNLREYRLVRAARLSENNAAKRSKTQNDDSNPAI